MNQWLSQIYVSEHLGSTELSADFLLRLVPIRSPDAEVELEIEVALCGETVSLQRSARRSVAAPAIGLLSMAV